MAAPKVITPPTHPVIPLAEVRDHLCLAADGSQDERMEDYLRAAHAAAEHYTGLSIGTQTLELALDAFPDGAIGLPQGPVSGIVSIQYVATDGSLLTLTPLAYVLDDYSTPQWVLQAQGYDWPATSEVANAVRVRYTAGVMSHPVRAAILLTTAYLHENRGDVDRELPRAAESLLNTVKVYW